MPRAEGGLPLSKQQDVAVGGNFLLRGFGAMLSFLIHLKDPGHYTANSHRTSVRRTEGSLPSDVGPRVRAEQ